jgi:hypothetical protein
MKLEPMHVLRAEVRARRAAGEPPRAPLMSLRELSMELNMEHTTLVGLFSSSKQVGLQNPQAVFQPKNHRWQSNTYYCKKDLLEWWDKRKAATLAAQQPKDCTMNFQEIYDNALNGVLAQGRPSVNENGKCLYRGLGGAKCGIGHSIPDDRYTTTIEDIRAADNRIVNLLPGGFELEKRAAFTGAEPRVDANVRSFLTSLQSAHDASAKEAERGLVDFISAFKARMRDVAIAFSLNPGAAA